MAARRGLVVRALIATVLLLVVAGAALMIWARESPLAFYESATRAALAELGLERVETPTPSGLLVSWQGGQGPEVVMLHGAGDQAGAWSRVAAGLLEDYRLVILDLPGHGESEPATGPLPMAQVYGGLEAFLQARSEATPPVLVGNSMGAWLAMVYAHRHPDAVQRVVAVNGGPLRNDMGDLTLTPANREQARRLMEALRDPSSEKVPDFVLDDIVDRAASGPIGRLVADPASLDEHLLDGRLAEIGTPVDVVWGESDRLMRLEYAERMVAELPRARLTVVPKCGHVPQNECPERFAAILETTLDSPLPEPAAPAAETPAEEAAAGEGDGDDSR